MCRTLPVNDRKKTPLARHGGNLDQITQRAAEPIEPPHQAKRPLSIVFRL